MHEVPDPAQRSTGGAEDAHAHESGTKMPDQKFGDFAALALKAGAQTLHLNNTRVTDSDSQKALLEYQETRSRRPKAIWWTGHIPRRSRTRSWITRRISQRATRGDGPGNARRVLPEVRHEELPLCRLLRLWQWPEEAAHILSFALRPFGASGLLGPFGLRA
ncbi:unnamed protein product [Effrenium voratum]|nr:unnamed protein product [Effrenium voratum]